MKKKFRLPDSELEIMLIIWQFGDRVSTTQIMENVRQEKSVQLVQSYLKRLEDKKFVRVEKFGRLNFYIPLISLEDYRNRETVNFIDAFYQKSPTKLFATLIENNQIDENELNQIRKLLEDDD